MDAKRQKLLEAVLGPHLGWTKPALVPSIGPHDPSVFDTYEGRRNTVVAELEERLRRCDEDEIAVLLGEKEDDPTDARREWRRFHASVVERAGLWKRPPPWYAAGLGHPEHVADFGHWSRMSRFTVDELLCLSVGVEPDRFPPTLLTSLREDDPDKLWPVLRFLSRRREQFIRVFWFGDDERRVSPREFLNWVDRVDLEAHPEFLRLLRQFHGKGVGSSAATPTEAPPPDRREIDSIAQLFTAMAIDQLGYDPKQAKSPIPKEIADLAASMGLSVTPETVRKFLRLGASFIPPDWKREQR